MSLVSTYVQTQEGHWYKDPVIRRKDWFVCWDDDEPIELVVATGSTTIEAVIKELNRLGWRVRKAYAGYRSHRDFSGKSNDFRQAESCFLTQAQGPTDYLLNDQNNTRLETMPKCQGVFYHNARIKA